MYQDQVEQYKKQERQEKETKKQSEERNSRWKTNNNEKPEISDRNGNNGAHKRAESYNINEKKKDAYDMATM